MSLEGIRILLYHSVGEVDPRDNLGIRVDKDDFYRQMKYLADNDYNVCSLEDGIEYIKKHKPIPPKTVIISFDDGYKDNILFALPMLEKFGFSAIFFITVEYIGMIKTSPRRDWQHWECMSWEDLSFLLKKGYLIGSHSLHHVDLTKVDQNTRLKEICLSKKILEDFLKVEIDFFSYPYGYFDNMLSYALRDAGYKAGCTTISGINNYATDLYSLKRIEVLHKDTLSDFIQKMGGN